MAGIFIAIEGTDGSGKGTQFQQLKERLQREGHEVAAFDFPQYDSPSAYFIKKYLNGEYGTAEEVGPYIASLFYALDRYEAAPHIRQALDEGKVVISNRFTGSNMAHQGTKFDRKEDRQAFFNWCDQLEFGMLGIPRPDLNIILKVPAEVAQGLVDQKGERGYTDKKRDLHEADLNHLKRSVEVYDSLAGLFPKNYQVINCTKKGKLQSIDAIHEAVWKLVKPTLKGRSPAAAKASGGAVKTQDAPAATKPGANRFVTKVDEGRFEITDEGRKFLEEAVTNPTDDVYVFTDKISPIIVAAAMARLSRRGDDMRITMLDEFAEEASKGGDLLKRVITAYGDDSVQQLAGIHAVVENASNLLTKKLEWGRLASYLEQSTRYIYFDQKDKNGKFKYYTPTNFDAATAERYDAVMDQIFTKYSELVRQLTDYVRDNSSEPEDKRDMAWKGATRAQACDAARPVLPVATKSTVGIFASGQAYESLIMHLLSEPLVEAKVTGQKLLDEGRKVLDVFLERADKPDRGGAAIAYRANTAEAVKKIAEAKLPDQLSDDYSQPAKLVGFWPKNELDLVPHMLYEHSGLSLEEIEKNVEQWSYEDREAAFNAYVGERLNRRHRPGRAFEQAHYSWDIVCDYGIFRDLQRHRIVDDLRWQDLTPRFGYDVPQLVEDAGLTELFEECFDLSYQLYSDLQAAGYQLEAQYATLLGHKMRWKITYNAREAFHLHELRTTPQGHPGYRKLVKEMHDLVAEVHPLTAAAMRFVNKDEDAELTRLAAERYTQYKLEQLDAQTQQGS